MGKTERGSVWLDASLTSPYDYYQFWINTEDPDVERFLALFTFLPMDEVRALGRHEGAELRDRQGAAGVRGDEAHARRSRGARGAGRRAGAVRRPGRGGGRGRGAVRHRTRGDLDAGIRAADLFVAAGLCGSVGEARRLIAQRGAHVNDRLIERPDELFSTSDLVDGALLLRKGKKDYRRVLPG